MSQETDRRHQIWGSLGLNRISMPQIIELRKHVYELIRTLEVTVPENIHITLDMDRQNSLYVAVDPVQFELAIVNLIRNACDAMPNGGLIEVISRKEEEITLMIYAIPVAVFRPRSCLVSLIRFLLQREIKEPVLV
jgi:signal transduction histidine kinase